MISLGIKAARRGSESTTPVPIDLTPRAITLLGGASSLQMKRFNPFDWVSAIRRGFPSKTLDAFATNVGASNSELAAMLGLSARAWAGRRCKQRLSPADSERLLRLAKAVARAEDVFGDLSNGLAWLNNSNRSLVARRPLLWWIRKSALNWWLMSSAESNTGLSPDHSRVRSAAGSSRSASLAEDVQTRY
ncbi:Conserved hypothetical protein 2293 [Thiobacillus denitrificans ATCC 25259]|uniref:Antitoxin Xre-like helix-turn-helix domain-containing protein n=1 Tax=Thiobacillus denitrificans (strain ATCC 25259 / T1) TaxID=292415 RepID=Q3SLT0_THIDA|nr:Conserved hypothetical protein 2293 [Thiobacillus denitrificans ATCC 25259]